MKIIAQSLRVGMDTDEGSGTGTIGSLITPSAPVKVSSPRPLSVTLKVMVLPLILKLSGLNHTDAPPEVGVTPYFFAVNPFRLENVTASWIVSPSAQPPTFNLKPPSGGGTPL